MQLLVLTWDMGRLAPIIRKEMEMADNKKERKNILARRECACGQYLEHVM